MLPSDSPQQDWNLYFNDTFMLHETKGIVYVKVRHNDEGEYYLKAYTIDSRGKVSSKGFTCGSSKLGIYWPRPGAYNITTQDTAVFIGRSAQRHMKRSASFDHYFITWSPSAHMLGHIVPFMGLRQVFPTLEKFKERAKSKDIYTRALSARLILHKAIDERIYAIYMGEMVGHIDDDDKFVPHQEFDSRTRRISEHLANLGVKSA
jgi:hypothetical protein